MSCPIRLPYFDALLKLLDEGNPTLERTFGNHVHWGYWPEPEQADGSVEDFATAAEALSRLVYRAAAVDDGMTVLDAGCGLGGTVASLNAGYSDLGAVGLNIDRRQLRRAAERVPATHGNRLDWVQADACSLPFANESFDAVLAVECIFHFPSRERFFREAYRVLKPGGRLALSDFVPTRTLRPLLRLVSMRPESIGFYGHCNLHCTLADYLRLAAATGFEVDVEDDITAHTLPTYTFLRHMASEFKVRSPAAALETLFAEVTSRLGLLRYCVLGFGKPGV